MELRHPLSGDMAVVKSAPRCKSSFNRCAVALPLVMSHAPSTRQSAVTRSPQKVVWPQRAHLRRHHHHGAPRARLEDSLATRPIIFPRREARQTRQTERLKMYTFFSHPPPSLRSIPPSAVASAACLEVAAAAALDISTRNLPLSLPPSSLPDIPDIPENIKGCQALQIVDFSSNPIPR